MRITKQLASMRTFLIIWSGQIASLVGSYMTTFALTLWAWELTGQATALALVYFFNRLANVLISPLAGMIVDRWNRKLLLVASDAVAGLSTLIILLLYLTNNLQIWHIYVTSTINGAFSSIQWLAYSASVSLLVPKEQYGRVGSLDFLASYGADIIAPALAASFYYVIGLSGILCIDLMTFAIAVTTLLLVSIPQPPLTSAEAQPQKNIRQELFFGFRYILARPSLMALVAVMSLFQLAHDFGAAVYSPMVLARSNNNASALASVSMAAGLGGVFGASIMSTWGGPKRRMHGVLMSMVGAGLSKTVFGLGQNLSIWVPAQFCSSFNFPFLGSCSQAIWLSKVKPDLQGRVFAANSMCVMVTSPIGYLLGGPLADYVLEPAMQPGGSLAPVFGGIFGTGAGAGMALLYVSCSICMLLIGLTGYAFPMLRNVEKVMPDHDTAIG
ncbi:MAG TPA: MFS transporter [Coleofasciculaceae cyanobacterium]